MILNREFYNRVPLLRRLWISWQRKKLSGDKLFKAMRLHRTEYPGSFYFYSPRLKSRPVFTGDQTLLAEWKDAGLCAQLCPTRAIRFAPGIFDIDPNGCIACGLCLEMAPKGLLVVKTAVLEQGKEA
jgi:NAD-dependent dihydropyrimidine dehydrogenase PreA subunit